MKIATYNLFEGAANTGFQLEQFAAEAAIDVLCLQEVNGWQHGAPSRLEQFAARTGLAHYVYGDSNTDYKLATLSRYPIAESRVHTAGLWHCAVQATIQTPIGPIETWNAHLNPAGEAERLPEARFIASAIDPDPGKLALVTGDLNSLSQADAYPDSLGRELAGKGITKFGAGRLRFDVMGELLSHGLMDPALLTPAQTNTVPTPANTDKFHAARLRLDYTLVTKALCDRVTAVEVPKNELTNRISDHYPVVLTVE